MGTPWSSPFLRTSGKDVFVTAMTSDTSATATASFANFTTRTPTITFTPTRSKKYMVLSTGVYSCNTAGASSRLRLNASAGSPTVVYSQEAAWDSPGNNYFVTQTLWQIVTLTAGTAYTFDVQVKNNGTATTVGYGTGGASNGTAVIAIELD